MSVETTWLIRFGQVLSVTTDSRGDAAAVAAANRQAVGLDSDRRRLTYGELPPTRHDLPDRVIELGLPEGALK